MNLRDRVALERVAYASIEGYEFISEEPDIWRQQSRFADLREQLVDFMQDKTDEQLDYLVQVFKKEHVKSYLEVNSLVCELKKERLNAQQDGTPSTTVGKIVKYIKDIFKEEKDDEAVCTGSGIRIR